jgi:hypothetical protein
MCEAAKLVDNAALRQRNRRNVARLRSIIQCGQLWGAHGRVVGDFVRAGARRLCGAARDNGPVCSVATRQPPTLSEIHSRLSWRSWRVKSVTTALYTRVTTTIGGSPMFGSLPSLSFAAFS